MPQRTIVEERSKNVVIMDVFSKLAQNRIIFIDDAITSELANGIIAQLLYLDSISQDRIDIYINSPGGNVYDGFGIYDVAKLLKSPIRTIGIGLIASMGAFLMFMGSERCATKHTRIMLHQPSGFAVGSSDDIEIYHEELQKIKKDLYKIIAENTTLENVEQLFKLDTWFSAEEALNCKLLTEIL